jgi:putative FmdB family regulatory protein
VPTYEYECTECGNRFDIEQRFTDDALTTCDKCQGPLRKVFSAVGVVFKGSGFYKTDSRSSGTKSTSTPKEAPAKSDAPAAATTTPASSTSTTTPSTSSTPAKSD